MAYPDQVQEQVGAGVEVGVLAVAAVVEAVEVGVEVVEVGAVAVLGKEVEAAGWKEEEPVAR